MRRHHRPHPDDCYYGTTRPALRTATARGHALRLSIILGLTAVLILSVLVVSSRAQTVDPYDVLEQYADAMGGMDRLRESAWMRTKGTLEVAGLTGTIDRHRTIGDLSICVIDDKIIVTDRTRYGQGAYARLRRSKQHTSSIRDFCIPSSCLSDRDRLGTSITNADSNGGS
jgi:hypothetical protein